MACAAFGRLKYIFKKKELPICFKNKVFDQCILSVFTYNPIYIKSANELKVAQQAIERSKLGITLADRKTNIWIQQTKVCDIISKIAQLIWQWADHRATTDDRWTRIKNTEVASTWLDQKPRKITNSMD